MANGSPTASIIAGMNKATFGHRDALTVGEAWSATPGDKQIF